MVASSRLVFAVARDGVLPLSEWLCQVNEKRQPRNSLMFICIFAAVLECLILPSEVAFTSILSGGSIPIAAAYGLIAWARLLLTPGDFRSTKFRLGPFRMSFYLVAGLFNLLFFIVRVLKHLLLPLGC